MGKCEQQHSMKCEDKKAGRGYVDEEGQSATQKNGSFQTIILGRSKA